MRHLLVNSGQSTGGHLCRHGGHQTALDWQVDLINGMDHSGCSSPDSSSEVGPSMSAALVKSRKTNTLSTPFKIRR